MKNILVPTDFSANCMKAADLGIEMAKRFHAEIHFLHLLETPVDWTKLNKQSEKNYSETLEKIGIAKATLRQLAQKADQANLENQTILEYHVGTANILKYSGHYDHDFIITGSSGTKGLVRELLGSNVEKIIRKSHVPVIVVKEESVRFPFKDIVFVSDFMEDISEAFKEVIAIAVNCGAKMHLLRINTKSDSNSIARGLTPIKKFMEKFPELQDYTLNVYNEVDVESGINTFLKNNKADLIALCTHGDTGFLRLFSKSVAEGVANHSSLPVMTVKI